MNFLLYPYMYVPDDLVFYKPDLFDPESKHDNYMTVYEDREMKKKLIVRTPVMMVMFNTLNQYGKFSNISLSFSPHKNVHNEDEITKFNEFIDRIDGHMKETCDDMADLLDLDEIMYKKSIMRKSEKYSKYISINLPSDRNVPMYKIFDENKKETTIDKISRYDLVCCFIQLSEIVFKKIDERVVMHCKWDVLQLIKRTPINKINKFFEECRFDEEPLSVSTQKTITNRIERKDQDVRAIESREINKSKPPPPPPPPVEKQVSCKYIPNPAELAKAISMLKKT